MKLIRVRLAFCLVILGLTVVSRAFGQTRENQSLDEVNKELSNPISSIWALQLQENTYWLNKPERNVVNLQFQPVLPLALTNNWNLITRPSLPGDELYALREPERKSSSRHWLR